MYAGELGQITTPRERRPPLPGVTWAADNGCYGKGYPGDEQYLSWLTRHREHRAHCLFATAPDVVGDALETAERSAPMLPRIRALGYRAALVLQDGQELIGVPWDEVDAVFVGGTDEFKLGPVARELALEARRRGKYVHCGRVNSYKRIAIAFDMGAMSSDGTFVNKAPHHNLDRMRVWFTKLAAKREREYLEALQLVLGVL